MAYLVGFIFLLPLMGLIGSIRESRRDKIHSGLRHNL